MSMGRRRQQAQEEFWLGADAKKIVGAEFKPLRVVKA